MGIGCRLCVISSAEENSQRTESHLCQQLVSCTSKTPTCICMHLKREESINTDGTVKMSRLKFRYIANEKQMNMSYKLPELSLLNVHLRKKKLN